MTNLHQHEHASASPKGKLKLHAQGDADPAPNLSSREHPRVPRRPDWEIASEVRAALKFSLGAASGRLTTVVKNGSLSLFGNVNFEVEKSTALNCVETVPGVLGVSDHIVLSSVFVARP